MISNLAAIRKVTGLSQVELATKSGCSRYTIGKIESGDYNPTLDLVYRITSVINQHPKTQVNLYIEDIFPNPYLT